MTKEQFLEFSFASPELLILFQEWKNVETSRRRSWMVPSVDRIDNDKGYCLSNIRWVTWEENYLKEMERQRKGAPSPSAIGEPALEE